MADTLGQPVRVRKEWACGCQSDDDRREQTWVAWFVMCDKHRTDETTTLQQRIAQIEAAKQRDQDA